MTYFFNIAWIGSLALSCNVYAGSKSSKAPQPTKYKNQNFLKAFLDQPTENRLVEFRNNCKGDKLFFNDELMVTSFVSKVLETKSELLMRALVLAVQESCIDGAIATGLSMDLGNQLLVKLPETLIKAIYKEKANRLWTISKMENDEWFAVECEDQKCVDRFNAYFDSKRSVLNQLKLDQELTAIQKKLIEAIPKILLNKGKK